MPKPIEITKAENGYIVMICSGRDDIDDTFHVSHDYTSMMLFVGKHFEEAEETNENGE